MAAQVKVGLALGSGAVHGLAHIGVIRALSRHGLPFDVITGTSAGALAGVLLASGLSMRAIDALARQFDWQSSTSLVFPWLGLVSNKKLQQRLDAALSVRPIEALPHRFAAVATDIDTGQRVVLSRGPAGPAIGASAAIPVLFAPVRINGRDLVDGSLVEPVPVRAARELGADFVVAVDVAFRPDEAAPAGVVGIAFQMMHVMVNALIDEQIGSADYALRLNLHEMMRFESNPYDVLVDAGERAVETAWPAIRQALGAAGLQLPAEAR